MKPRSIQNRVGRRAALGVVLTLGLAGCTGDPVTLMNQGVERLEAYDYLNALKIFQKLSSSYPGWEAAQVNRGIAALNLQSKEYLDEAELSFDKALGINPKCLPALVSRGMLYQHQNRIDEMLRDYDLAAKIDPEDPHILYQRGTALLEKGRVDDAQVDLEKVVRLQPSFASAYWKLRELFVRRGEREKMMGAIDSFQRLEAADANQGVKMGLKYGEGGKYNFAIRGTAPPGWKGSAAAPKPTAPVFGPRVRITQQGAVASQRPDGRPSAPAFAVGDLDGDGALDLVLSAEKDASGSSAAVYSPDGASGWKLRGALPLRDVRACALGDVDGDLDLDLVAAGEGWLRFLENDGAGKLTEKDWKVEGSDSGGYPVRLLAIDADSDWDLDVLCLRQVAGSDGKVQSRLQLLNNNRDGTFKDIAAACGLGPFPYAASELIASDLDGDVDADILVFNGAGGTAVQAFANDRVWRYHPVLSPGATLAPGLRSCAAGDLDGDGDQDLILCCDDRIRLWWNEGGIQFAEETGPAGPTFDTGGASAAVLADFQGNMTQGLVLIDAARKDSGPPGALYFAAPSSPRGWRHSSPLQPIQLSMEGLNEPAERSAAAVFVAKGRPPELIVYDAKSGASSYPILEPKLWFAVDFQGPRKPVAKAERSNTGGVGADVEVARGVQRFHVQVGSGLGGAGRTSTRLFCGLADATGVDYVRVLWPDAVLQIEKGMTPGTIHRLVELERKPSSCPILFAWTGASCDFVADFLGVGGLGYFETPGVYSKPDPSEYVLLPALQPKDGSYLLDVLEPLEECTYLDELKLTVVDHPADVTVVPDEMFAVRGPAPGFRLLAFREKAFARSAHNDQGRDVTEKLERVDRQYGNSVRRDARFPGLALATHWIDLDFEDAISSLLARGAASRPHLILHGYVEYGYSTSNFAAWQAGAEFRAPTVLALRAGKWEPLRVEWGFPGGYPRYMAVDLTGALTSADRRLRVETNLDVHWDQAFLADASVEELEITDVEASVAALGFRGFPPEESPDGSHPRVYVYRDFVPESPYRSFPGNYTRYGDVRELLRTADDRFAILGPGDGLRFEVSADRLPPLRPGWKRTFFAKAFGYCKDTDLYTAHPDSIEPLPFQGMSGYPFAPAESIAPHEAQAPYVRDWNVRTVK